VKRIVRLIIETNALSGELSSNLQYKLGSS
jgi:hypothetical protein